MAGACKAAGVAAAVMMMASGLEAAEIRVMSSAAIKDAYNGLVPAFEKAGGHTVVTEWVPTVEMMRRLGGGEAPDLVIMASNGVEKLIKDGRMAAGSRIDIAKSGIGIGIKQGAARPDVSTTDAVIKAVRAAKTVAYSTGPSGAYMAELFERLGLTAELKPKLKVIQGVPVGDVVARGDAEIGFQQVPELVPVKGLDYLGVLPADIQQITVFSGTLPVGSKESAAAKALIAFLRTPAAISAFKKTGMEPG